MFTLHQHEILLPLLTLCNFIICVHTVVLHTSMRLCYDGLTLLSFCYDMFTLLRQHENLLPWVNCSSCGVHTAVLHAS